MAKKPQSNISKAMDKATKLSVKGKYDEAVKVLLPYQNDSGVKKIIEATRNLGKSVKELKADPLHKRFRWQVKVKGNRVSVNPKEKPGCWPFK